MAKTQKILHTVRRFVFNEWGGTEAVVWNSALGLLNNGIPNSILATSALDKNGKELRSGCQIERFPYFYPRLGLNQEKTHALDKKGGDPYSLQLFQALIKEPSRLIHCHSMQRMAAMTRLAARVKNVPYVMSLHGGQYNVPKSEIQDMTVPTRGTINYGRFIDIVTRPNKTLNDASGIICVGYEEYQSVKKRFPFKPCVYLPNGVNTSIYTEGNGDRFKHHYNIDANKKVILCVSRIDPQKNQLALAELLATLHRQPLNNETHHLVLIGPVTNQAYADQINSVISQNGLSSHFTLIPGFAPESQELVDAYHAGDVFILPSIHEPFGIVALEAWASGIPVIASNIGGLSNLITNKVNGLHFNPYKDRSLIDTYRVLNSNKELEAAIIRTGMTEAANHYSWESYIDRLCSFYDDVECWYRNKYSKTTTQSYFQS